jgi:hypothetical protein
LSGNEKRDENLSSHLKPRRPLPPLRREPLLRELLRELLRLLRELLLLRPEERKPPPERPLQPPLLPDEREEGGCILWLSFIISLTTWLIELPGSQAIALVCPAARIDSGSAFPSPTAVFSKVVILLLASLKERVKLSEILCSAGRPFSAAGRGWGVGRRLGSQAPRRYQGRWWTLRSYRRLRQALPSLKVPSPTHTGA